MIDSRVVDAGDHGHQRNAVVVVVATVVVVVVVALDDILLFESVTLPLRVSKIRSESIGIIVLHSYLNHLNNSNHQ